MNSTPQRTPLYAEHQKLKARIVDFHGWEMPIQYAGIVEEHAAVRHAAGLFDLSHMGRVRVLGKDRRAFLQKLLTVNLDTIKPGRCRYTFLLNEKGTIIDDLLIYAGETDDLLVVNASNREKDVEWMKRHLSGDVRLEDETFSVSLIATQGPQSLAKVKEALGVDPSSLKYYTWGPFGDYMLSRTGYTGEDGFEVFVPTPKAADVWNKFIQAGLPPVGLGARDTLRAEASMPLYGNDIDDTTTPLEAGLDFAVDLTRDFIGRDALKAAPPRRKLSGLVLAAKRIPRQGFDVYAGGAKAGVVTTGTWSPTLEKSIAMAYLPLASATPGTSVEIDVRGKREPATVVKMPFYRREKS
ncbi:MAG TPA: glycine cleavage system aminomethyltransferase GcvT [Planctomycetota bacterium]